MVSGVGICSDDRCVYHLSIAEERFETRLSVLDRDSLEVLGAQTLAEISDGHSIRRLGDDLVVASTGMDDVVAYRLDGHRAANPRLVWSPTGASDDTHHINSLEIVGNELVCTAFGPKTDASWRSATQGYLYNISGGTMLAQGLQQPHSARFFGDCLFFCNSRRGTVETTTGVVVELDGYSRGLDFGPDGAMVAGTSVGRRSSTPDEGAFLNPGDPIPDPRLRAGDPRPVRHRRDPGRARRRDPPSTCRNTAPRSTTSSSSSHEHGGSAMAFSIGQTVRFAGLESMVREAGERDGRRRLPDRERTRPSPYVGPGRHPRSAPGLGETGHRIREPLPRRARRRRLLSRPR